jgi:PAS domain S-box-containing protein
VFTLSVRRFLTLALIAAGILPILVFGVAFRATLGSHIEEDIQSLSVSMLKTLSAQAGSSLLDGTRRDLPAILLAVEGPALRSAGEGELLKAFRKPHDEYALLAVLDYDYVVRAASFDGEGIEGSPYSLHAALVPGIVTFSDPFRSELTHEVAVEAAYSNGHRTIVALLNLGMISSKLVLIAGDPKDRLGVVDGEGRYLACSDPSRAQRLESVDPSCLVPGPKRIRSEGSEYYAASAPVPGTSWRLLYLREASKAEAPMIAFLGSLVALAAAALACTAAISLLAWKNIATPLAALVARIDSIAEGRYSERVEGSFASEFMEIGRAFNEMAGSIEKRDRELLRSEERYRLLFSRNSVPTFVVDPEALALRYANEAALAYYGYSREEFSSLVISDIDEAPRDTILANAAASVRGEAGCFLARHRLRSGEIRDVELYASPVELEGRISLYCVIFDVTQRRIAEEKTAQALAERTLLLREVYHRVKNNLQIISSLLNLQAESVSDPISLQTLRTAQDRVYAMSLAHELVYQMNDFASLELGRYIDRVVGNLLVAHGLPEGAANIAACPMKLELERAVPFGLAMNELVSNAFKYAGPSASRPVAIRLEVLEEGGRQTALFTVEDQGPGVPADIAQAGEKPGSLGLSLIGALAKQLGGSASWKGREGGSGTLAVLRFPVADKSRPEEG